MPSGGADLDWLLRHPRELRFAPSKPPVVLPCEMVLTFVQRSNGRLLNVRCRCMAQTVGKPRSERFYNYDPLGQAEGLEAALELFRKHVADRSAVIAVNPEEDSNAGTQPGVHGERGPGGSSDRAA